MEAPSAISCVRPPHSASKPRIPARSTAIPLLGSPWHPVCWYELLRVKSRVILLVAMIGLAARSLHAQATFIYDQQSSADEFIPYFGGGPTMQQIPTPWGQSFTPALSGVDFIRLKLDDDRPGNGIGATIYLNLRSDSMTGTILGTTASISMLDGFRGNPTFFFPATVPVTPGTTYYLEPITGPGSDFSDIIVDSFNYPGGSYIRGGLPVLYSDLWFREGLYIVPEPSSALLLLLGATGLACSRCRLRRDRRCQRLPARPSAPL
jgi:hypothetical protein